jgi:hypothetical protein
MIMTKRSENSARKNVACVEGFWDDTLEERITATALLDLASKLSDVRFAFTVLSCNTKEEFEFNIFKLCASPIKKHYRVLYLVLHGEPGMVFFSNEVALSLEDLAAIMKENFRDWVVHFSSCSTLDVPDSRLRDFICNTKVALITGYTKNMYWSECLAMDLLLLENIADYKRLWYMKKRVLNRYAALVRLTGFKFYPCK